MPQSRQSHPATRSAGLSGQQHRSHDLYLVLGERESAMVGISPIADVAGREIDEQSVAYIYVQLHGAPSSRMSTLFLCSNARASAIICLCPTEKFSPLPMTRVSSTP